MEQQRAELDQKLLLICEDIEQCLTRMAEIVEIPLGQQ